MNRQSIPQRAHLPERKPKNVATHAPTQADAQAALANPATASPADVMALQQAAGNQAVTDWAERSPAPGDALDAGFSQAVQSAHGSGQTLPGRLREQLEHDLHADFGAVRLHVDEQADTLNRQIGAKAFTVGSDVFFQSGAYAPHSPEGQRTLKHELTHVVQQKGKSSPHLRLGPENDAHEQEAQHVSQGKGATAQAGTAPAGGVQRLRLPGLFGKLASKLSKKKPAAPQIDREGARAMIAEMIKEKKPEHVISQAVDFVAQGLSVEQAKKAANSNYQNVLDRNPVPKPRRGQEPYMRLTDLMVQRESPMVRAPRIMQQMEERLDAASAPKKRR